MSTSKFAKFLLGLTVACMAIFCVLLPFLPFVGAATWYFLPVYGLPGVFLSSAFCLILMIYWDGGNKIIVKTPRLPRKVFFWGLFLASTSFLTNLQVNNGESPVAQALMIFAVVFLACAVVLAGLLWLTTEPASARPGLTLVK